MTINLKPGSKGIMVLIAIAAVIFIGCIAGCLAVSNKMKNTTAELDAKLNKVNESKQIAQKLEKSKLAYLDAQSAIKCLETSVSTEAYVPTLLKQLEQTAKMVKLKVINVQPERVEKKPAARSVSSGAKASSGNVEQASKTKDAAKAAAEAPKPYEELNIALEFEGKYSNVLDFLYRITSFPKILAVKSVSISQKAKLLTCNSTPELVVKMTVTAFVLKKDDPVRVPDSSTRPKGSANVVKGRAGNEAG
ncbi:MAG: type 4a pilus biogenesis protein PilO [Armatimonadetes bacterium]|nr:type 4a pilus biogenesis protein PilO [Armatimonadota bacterium]